MIHPHPPQVIFRRKLAVPSHRFCRQSSAIPTLPSYPRHPTLDNPNRFALTGVAAARRILHLAATRRVDLCIIGDSNTRQLTTSGHEDGMGRAFAIRFGMDATRVDPFAGQGSWGSDTLSGSTFQTGPFDAITFWAVLEHVEQPRLFLKKAAALKKVAVAGGSVKKLCTPTTVVEAGLLVENGLPQPCRFRDCLTGRSSR